MNPNNKKSTITIIVLLITVIVLLLGIMIYLLFGGNMHIPTPLNESASSSQDFNENYDANSISTIDISAECGNLYFKESDNDKIIIEGSNYSKTKIQTEQISNKLVIKRITGGSSILSLKGLSNLNLDITIYLPKGFSGKIDASVDAGNIISSGVLSGKIDFETDAGNIELDTFNGKFELSTDAGNIEIEQADLTSDSSAETSMGNITIDRLNPVKVVSDTDMGNANINASDSSSPVTLKVETSMGNIDIN